MYSAQVIVLVEANKIHRLEAEVQHQQHSSKVAEILPAKACTQKRPHNS